MKLALLVALAEDRRSGRVISQDLVPYDQGLKLFKEAVNDGLAPAADLPNLELWTAAGFTKCVRFNPARARAAVTPKSKGGKGGAAAAKLAAELEAVNAKHAELEVAHAAAVARIAELEAAVTRLPLQQAAQSGAAGEKPSGATEETSGEGAK